jgi:hypothetical protein
VTDMQWSLLALLYDGREYTIGEAMAHTATEADHIHRIRRAMADLVERGLVLRRGRGLPMYRISPLGKSELRMHRAPQVVLS